MDIVVISQKNAKDRRATLDERLEYGGITKYRVFDAITSKDVEVYDRMWNDEDIVYPFGVWKHDPRLKNKRKNTSRIACYLSHSTVIKRADPSEKLVILEDDIYFKKQDVFDITLGIVPEDCFIAFWDCTHIEYLDKTWNIYKTSGWYKIDPTKVRVWCAGCYLINNVEEVQKVLNDKKEGRVWDKCLIDYFQKNYPCYIWLAPSCYQDRNTFESSIK